jgi:ribosomal protein S27AE
MRNSKLCPKCRSADIIRIPINRTSPYAFVRTRLTIFGAVKLSRYVCGSCGYSEEWVDRPDDIAKLKRLYAS